MPGERVATAASRAALPAQVSHADASFTAGRAALLGAGAAAGDPRLFAAALADRLHEPFRAASAPLLQAVREARPAGALGATLSGSGPTVIVWVEPGRGAECASDLAGRFRSARVLVLAPSAVGDGVVTYRFVDCRWELGKPDAGRELYLAGHIPGAAFLDVERDLSAPPGEPPAYGGRHPLPDEATFAAAAGRAGIGPGVVVVAYDQGRTGGAARLWWLLRHFGHENVAVLRGGIDSWIGPLGGGEEEDRAARVRPPPAQRRHGRGGRAGAPPGRERARGRRRARTRALPR